MPNGNGILYIRVITSSYFVFLFVLGRGVILFRLTGGIRSRY